MLCIRTKNLTCKSNGTYLFYYIYIGILSYLFFYYYLFIMKKAPHFHTFVGKLLVK